MTRHCLKASWCSVMRMALKEFSVFNIHPDLAT